jgi:DNA-binding response OmpR family regulator
MSEEKIQVLIADDEDPLRITVAAWLADEGFDVEEAGDGLEAIKKIQGKNYDIAMLDIKMPGVNGLEVLRYAKKNSPQTEVVMMTGMSDVGMAVEAMKIGAKEYLTKPIDMEQIVPQLRAIIKTRNAEDRIRKLQAEYTARLLFDLHNPIAGLRQSIGYLLKEMAGPINDHQQELLGYMTISIDKVIALLTDMMDLTKLEAGRVTLNKGIANLATAVQHITQEFRVPVQSNRITLDRTGFTELSQQCNQVHTGSRCHRCAGEKGRPGDGRRTKAARPYHGISVQQRSGNCKRRTASYLRPVSRSCSGEIEREKNNRPRSDHSAADY